MREGEIERESEFECSRVKVKVREQEQDQTYKTKYKIRNKKRRCKGEWPYQRLKKAALVSHGILSQGSSASLSANS
jgi:hypothetical protein